MPKFTKGSPSANPAGRPKGSKSIVSLLRNDLVSETDLQLIIDKVVELAKGGDLIAAAMVLDRICPKLRPSANVVEEAELAEATTAAKVRGAFRETKGMNLEELLTAASREDDLETLITGTAELSVDLDLQRQRRAAIENGYGYEQ